MKMRSCHGGFTLVELLVAISVLAIVAVLGWRGLDGIVRARVALTKELEHARGMQLAFAQMQRDYSQIAELDTLVDKLPVVVEPGRIILTRKVFAENKPSHVQLISYQLKNGVLMRRESLPTRDLSALDKLWFSVTSESGGAPGVVLQSGVTSMNVRIWLNDGAGWRVPQTDAVSSASSGAAATAATSQALVVPTGIEVGFELQDRPGSLTKMFLLGAV
jgi:general secretion pathway protein J